MSLKHVNVNVEFVVKLTTLVRFPIDTEEATSESWFRDAAFKQVLRELKNVGEVELHSSTINSELVP